MRDTALHKAGSGKESCQLNASGMRLKSMEKYSLEKASAMSCSPPRNNCPDMDDEETSPKKKSRTNAETEDHREKHPDPTDEDEKGPYINDV